MLKVKLFLISVAPKILIASFSTYAWYYFFQTWIQIFAIGVGISILVSLFVTMDRVKMLEIEESAGFNEALDITLYDKKKEKKGFWGKIY